MCHIVVHIQSCLSLLLLCVEGWISTTLHQRSARAISPGGWISGSHQEVYGTREPFPL